MAGGRRWRCPGAACRYIVDYLVSARLVGAFPWGTWTVNITGSLLLGAIAGTAARSGQPQLWQVAATSGICGAYTTFSTFMYETLIERRAWWDAIWNLTSLLAGVEAAAAGWLLATPLVG